MKSKLAASFLTMLLMLSMVTWIHLVSAEPEDPTWHMYRPKLDLRYVRKVWNKVVLSLFLCFVRDIIRWSERLISGNVCFSEAIWGLIIGLQQRQRYLQYSDY